MANTPLSPRQVLEDCSDPILLADADASVRWFNRAASEIIGLNKTSPLELADIFEPGVVSEILSCEHFKNLEIELKGPFEKKIRQSLLIVSAGSSDPDGESFLIVLKSFTPKNTWLTEREDALTNVAHDLKNPIGAIFGYADALLDTRTGDSLSPRQKDIIARIRSTASRSLELVRNFQHLSQLTQRISPGPGSRSDLNQAVRNVIEYTWREDQNKPATSVRLAGGRIPAAIERIQIDRVITNLYSNALKFTPPHGTISIGTRTENGRAVFEIANSLPLIPAAELELIFEKHSRASTSRGTSGSGLGLYIVRRILSFYNAEVSAESSEETGTVFRVTIPLAEESAQ